MRRFHPYPLLLSVGLLVGPACLGAQSVRGRVEDVETGQGVSGAAIEALREGEVVARTLADGEGGFSLQLGAGMAGSFRLRASRLGYPPQESIPLAIGAMEVVEVTLGMSPSPIPLDAILVEVRRTNLRHASSREGLYARRDEAHAVGRSRVVVRGDPEMRNAHRVEDVLQRLWFGRTWGAGCVDYYLNGAWRDGFLWGVLDLPIEMIEGIESYRNPLMAPMGLDPGRCPPGSPVVAVWLRAGGS